MVLAGDQTPFSSALAVAVAMAHVTTTMTMPVLFPAVGLETAAQSNL